MYLRQQSKKRSKSNVMFLSFEEQFMASKKMYKNLKEDETEVRKEYIESSATENFGHGDRLLIGKEYHDLWETKRCADDRDGYAACWTEKFMYSFENKKTESTGEVWVSCWE